MSGYRSGRADGWAAGAADALAAQLEAFGFRAMAAQCRAERAADKLQLYARIVLREAPAERRPDLRSRLEQLGLL